MKKRGLIILTAALAILVIFLSVKDNGHFIEDNHVIEAVSRGIEVSDDHINEIEILPDLPQIEVDYTIYQFPHPDIPMSYSIKINKEGVLTKEYFDIDRFNDISNIEKQLSQNELAGLIDIVITNKFFRLSKNIDGEDITDQPSRHLTIHITGEPGSATDITPQTKSI